MLQTIANMDFRRSRYFISSYCVYMVSFFAALLPALAALAASELLELLVLELFVLELLALELFVLELLVLMPSPNGHRSTSMHHSYTVNTYSTPPTTARCVRQ